MEIGKLVMRAQGVLGEQGPAHGGVPVIMVKAYSPI